MSWYHIRKSCSKRGDMTQKLNTQFYHLNRPQWTSGNQCVHSMGPKFHTNKPNKKKYTLTARTETKYSERKPGR
jgi:hypothetical protein